MQSWAAAIDINAANAEYWLWPRAAPANALPPEIIDIFERHGFSWGGKWSHYDAMHFEYRPEIIDFARRTGGGPPAAAAAPEPPAAVAGAVPTVAPSPSPTAAPAAPVPTPNPAEPGVASR